jgi:hypothetical protein
MAKLALQDKLHTCLFCLLLIPFIVLMVGCSLLTVGVCLGLGLAHVFMVISVEGEALIGSKPSDIKTVYGLDVM